MNRTDGLTPEMLSVFESVPDLYLILSPELRILTASDAYLAATLAERQQIAGKNVFEAFPENPHTPQANSVSNLRASLQEVLASRKPYLMPLQRYDVPRPKHLGGGFEEKHWQVLNSPVLDEEGNVAYIIHKVSDVSARVSDRQLIEALTIREQHALKEADLQRKRLYDLFMQAPALIATFSGPNYVYELANPLHQQLFPGRELLGKPLLEAVPEIKGHPILQLLDKVYQTGESVTGTEVPVSLDRFGNGKLETGYFDFTYQALRDAQGKVKGVITFGNEVTQAIRSRQALEQLNRQLEQRVSLRTKELKTTQLAAEMEHQRIEQLLMQAPALIAILKGPEHVFQLVNPPYQQLVGERELLGKSIKEAMPELEGQPIFGLLDSVYQTGESFYANEMLVQLDHTNTGRLGENYYNLVYQATRDLKGNIDGILVFAYEVTTLVLARQQVEQSRQRVQSLNEELATTNEELSLKNEELVGAKQGLEQLNTELEARVLARTKALERAQHEAERQREVLYNLFMEAPVPLLILHGEEFIYQLVNPAYQQIFPGRSLQGKALLEALPELKGTPIPAILQKVYKTGETFVAHEMPLMLARHQGAPLEEIYWTFTCQARHNQQGIINGVLVFAQEVTEYVRARWQLEEREKEAQALARELAAANKELQEANEQILASNEDLARSNQQLSYINADMDNFIYTASHDLRAPISNIEGLMHAMLRNLPEESRQQPFINKISGLMNDSIGRFKKTLDELTQITKIQREGSGEDVAQVYLFRLVDEIRLDLAQQIEQADARFELDMQACAPINFSAKNARSIVYNLVSNALKYRSPQRRPHIRISCYLEGEYQVLAVEDNGLGMDLAYKNKIFAMFKRLHDHVEGSGVGLYIVKRIIENAGGRIEVESELNVGSVFRVYFRKAAAPVA